ncbi:MAG: hypothetical protein ACO3RV_01575, partial [Luteolibacter sp.]
MKAVSFTLAAIGCFAHILGADPAREEIVPEQSPSLASELADEKIAISSSGQFQVSGGESLDRATAAMIADQAREELVALTADETTWKIPVSIKLERGSEKSAPSRISQIRLIEIEGAKRLEILYPIRRSHFHEELKRAVTSAILYELALLNEELVDLPMSVPPWLSDGLREATAWRQGRSDRRLYEAIFHNGGLFRLDDLLSLSEVEFQQLDGASLAAFRVSSGALVMALMAQPEDQSAFASFLREAAAHQGEMALLLRRHFPGLSLSKSSLAKWWSLQLAVIGGVTPLTEVMNVTQSEQQLEQTL